MDIVSYIMGMNAAEHNVIIEGDGYTCTDPENDGNVVITKEEDE